MGFSSQYVQLLTIVFKLKCWKLPFIIVVLAAAASQIYLYNPIQSMNVRAGASNLDVVGQKDFMSSNLVVGEWQKHGKKFLSIIGDASIRMSGNKKSEGIPMVSCDDEEDCQKKYFALLLGKEPGKISHYINFNSSKDQKPTLQCQVTSGSELYCPFIYYLISISLPLDELSLFQYKTVHTFRVKSSFSMLNTTRDGNSTLCTQDVSFPIVIQFVLMAVMFFLAAALVFYLLVSTVSCIYELKQNGFLKLMFHRRLSVWAYWLAIWTISLLEITVIAIVHTAAHHFQCPGFYPPLRLVLVFVGTFVQLCCATAFILLITVLTRDIVIASFAACLLHLIYVGCIVANKMALRTPHKYQWLRHLIFAVPFGHIAEQIYVMLLNGDIIVDTYFNIVLPASAALLVVLVAVTIYLDSAMKGGNGRRYPLNYIFIGKFWSLNKEALVTIKDPDPSVMVEDVPRNMTLKLCTYGLKKRYSAESVGLKEFSAIFYQDQITAIVGHNGSGKSTLLQILSGDRLATKGQATINKILITDPLYRNHLSNDIGYCPQADALVDGLTVLDSLVLMATSSGLEWDDVQQDVMDVLTALQIETKLNDTISSLSGSEKRRVCVTMALVGKPKVILLDNPARDLNYISKRRLWRLLHDYKKGRAVIMSTLFIDEAEGMADRMVFLTGGKVICAGSSFFMKRAFDCRFIIQIASKTEFHTPYLLRKITTKFNSVRVRSTDRADLEIEVPLQNDKILPSVALEIENMSELIDEFGIANYSLDDVYSKLKPLQPYEVGQHFMSSTIGYAADDVDRIKAIKSQPELVVPDGPVVIEPNLSVPITIFAMLMAHFIQVIRSTERIIVRFVVPSFLLLLLIGCGILEKSMKNSEMKLVHNLSEVEKLDTNHGACLYILSNTPHYDMITNAQCSTMLNNKNGTVQGHQSIGLPLSQFQPEDFVTNILNKKIFSDITNFCKRAFSPCPIIYAHNWCPDLFSPITTHQIYVGTLVSNRNETPIRVAATNIEVFKHLFSETTRVHIKFLKSKAVSVDKEYFAPSLQAQGITDLRSIFYPFYGMFIQLVLLAVMPSICLKDVIQDKRTGVYRQLVSMGMSRFHYWFCTLVNHWIQLAFVFILSTVFLMVIVKSGYTTTYYIVGAFIPTLILGLTNSLLCVYALSFVIGNFSYVYIVSYSFFSLTVAFSSLIVQANNVVGQFLVYTLPHYAIIAPTFYGTRFTHYSLAFFRKLEMPNLLGYILLVPHSRDALIALFVHFVLLIMLLVVLENRKMLCKTPAHGSDSAYELSKDESIVEEATKIEKNPKNEEHIMEANQVHVVNSEGKLVVKSLTFGLKYGEIFGLLGPYGAGKGSAIRAIVNDKLLSNGRVDFQVDDRWLSNASAVQQYFIGYCPRYNPLFERLTVRENLQFYARSIGVYSNRVNELLMDFCLENDANTVVLYATAGVKRRVTLAIAVLTSPRFMAINEPSDGVDPEGRQAIWQVIKSLAGKRRGMLVATQQMDEAESLCGRIGIVNGGLLAAMNDIHQMIARYKRMYFIELQVGQKIGEPHQNVERLKDEIIKVILEKFPGSIVMEKLTMRVQVGVPISSVGILSKALTWLLEQKKKFNLLFFTIHYATVDQTMKAIVVHNESLMFEQKEKGSSSIIV